MNEAYRLGSLFLEGGDLRKLDAEMEDLYQRLDGSDSGNSFSIRVWEALKEMRDENEGLKFDEIDQFDQFFYLDYLESRLGDEE